MFYNLGLVLDKSTGSKINFHNNPKYWDRQVQANSIGPAQRPQNVISDQCQQFAIYKVVFAFIR